MDALVEAALGEAERFFRVTPRGDWVQRVLAVRHAGLTWIHREDIASLDALAPLDRALAERVAAEAWLRLRHMELADVLEYVRLDYLSPDSGIDRYVECVTTLWDVVNRLEGGNISGRGTPFPRYGPHRDRRADPRRPATRRPTGRIAAGAWPSSRKRSFASSARRPSAAAEATAGGARREES